MKEFNSEKESPLKKIKETLFDFEKNQDTAGYQERIGVPKELPAAIGIISMSFQELENNISKRIIEMIDLRLEIGEIITAELSYKNKVNLFSSLYYERKEKYHFNSLPNYEKEYFNELLKALHKCEEMRNQILHSGIIEKWKTKEIIKTKTTAKAKKGLPFMIMGS